MSETPHAKFSKQGRINKTHGWAVFNWGALRTFERTRKQAIAKAEELVGEPWSELENYCEVHKVQIVLEVDPDE